MGAADPRRGRWGARGRLFQTGFTGRSGFLADPFRRRLGVSDHFLGLFRCDAGQFRQLLGFEEGQIVIGQEAFFDQGVPPSDPSNAGSGRNQPFGPLDAAAVFVVRHDFDVPADKLAGQAHILPAFADGQGQPIFLHQDNGPA